MLRRITRGPGAAAAWGLLCLAALALAACSGQPAASPTTERFAAVSAGLVHTCALRTDGSAVCWGDNAEGQAEPPTGERFTAVSAGGLHTCALRADGSAVCWGDIGASE